MKATNLIIALSLVGAVSAQADHHPRHRGPGHHRPHRPHNPHRRHDDIVVVSDCSPAVKQKNVIIVDNTMNEVSQSADFANASTFQTILAEIQDKKNSVDVKIVKYFQLVGVDATDTAALQDFVTARDYSTYVDHARRELKLSEAQAEKLVSTLKLKLLAGFNG
jgi:hypothetical protein